jgi:hypothetical protein
MRVLIYLLTTCLLLVCLVLGAARAADYPLDKLHSGMKGYGLTAGPGNVLERFPVEVLALQKDAGLGFPLVLVRASGDFIEHSGGIAAGMSGSPVYLKLNGQDALLGAISYVFASSDHDLAMVTPIEVMRRAEMGKSVASSFHPFGAQAFANLGRPVPVSTPLLISGLSQRAASYLRPLFKAANDGVSLFPVQASGGGKAGKNDKENYKLQPGSAISVELVRGDVTIAAIGTATAIEGGHILAFGHPLLGQGTVSFALAPAYVSYIVPSDDVPFKLAESGESLLGSIVNDRPYGVSGVLNAGPDFIPVTLTFNGPEGSATKHFEITNDERYDAPLLAAATEQLFDEATAKIGAGTADLAWEIGLKGQTIHLLEQTTDEGDIASAAANLAAEPLAILDTNPFAKPQVTTIKLNVSYDPAQRYADIVKIVPENTKLSPGDALIAHVRLQPYRSEPQVKTVSVPLPKGVTGPVKLTFRGGFTPEPEEDEEQAKKNPVLSYPELLTALQDNVQSSELVVEATVDGIRKRLLRLSLPYLVKGKKTVTVTVGKAVKESENKAEKKPPNAASGGAASGGSGDVLPSPAPAPQPLPDHAPSP